MLHCLILISHDILHHGLLRLRCLHEIPDIIIQLRLPSIFQALSRRGGIPRLARRTLSFKSNSIR